jgi:hypothetical protein
MTPMLHLAGLGRVDAALEDRAALVNGSTTEFGLAIADALQRKAPLLPSTTLAASASSRLSLAS